MRTMFFAALAAIGLLFAGISVAEAIEWKALAVNDYGVGSAMAYDEDEAKQLAIDDCEISTGYTCFWEQATSVPTSWYLVAVECRNGVVSTGSSQHGWEPARRKAAEKGDGHGCEIISRWRPFY